MIVQNTALGVGAMNERIYGRCPKCGDSLRMGHICQIYSDDKAPLKDKISICPNCGDKCCDWVECLYPENEQEDNMEEYNNGFQAGYKLAESRGRYELSDLRAATQDLVDALKKVTIDGSSEDCRSYLDALSFVEKLIK